MEAFEAVLSDKRFQFPSPQAIRARNLACSIVTWSKNPANQDSLSLMSDYITTSLTPCMITTVKTKKLKTGKMWGLYHLLRNSDDFKKRWIAFIKTATEFDSSTANHPALYQFVTHEMMKSLIKKRYHSRSATTADTGSTCAHSSPSMLSFEEQNALRYIAGYVLRKICKNVQESLHPEKEGLATCIKDLIGSCDDSDGDTDVWLKTIDRGGLWHVNQEVYALFELVEEHIRHQYSSPLDYSEGSKGILLEELLKDEDILFQWCFCFAGSKIGNEAGLAITLEQI